MTFYLSTGCTNGRTSLDAVFLVTVEWCLEPQVNLAYRASRLMWKTTSFKPLGTIPSPLPWLAALVSHLGNTPRSPAFGNKENVYRVAYLN